MTSNNTLTAAASVQLEAGTYWFATNIDTANATFVVVNGNSSNIFPEAIGNTNSAVIITATATAVGYKIAQTFGTWPDLTSSSGSMTAVQASTIPAIKFLVASVP